MRITAQSGGLPIGQRGGLAYFTLTKTRDCSRNICCTDWNVNSGDDCSNDRSIGAQMKRSHTEDSGDCYDPNFHTTWMEKKTRRWNRRTTTACAEGILQTSRRWGQFRRKRGAVMSWVFFILTRQMFNFLVVMILSVFFTLRLHLNFLYYLRFPATTPN